MQFRLNPVKATCALDWSKKDIIGPSDTCFGICTAFSSGNDPYNIQPECNKACEDYVERKKYEIFGVGSCDHQVPYKPVIWDNIPRFFPQLLMQKKLSPEQALPMCKTMCGNVPNLVEECIDFCNLDYSAVEAYNSGQKPKMQKSSTPTSQKNEEKNWHYLWYIVAFILMVLAVVISMKYT